MCGHNHPTMIHFLNDKALFWIPPKPKQSQLSGHLDFEVNNQYSLPPSIPRLRWNPWARNQTPNCSPATAAIWLPTAPVCVHSVCALGWVKCRAQIQSMGHTWPHVTSLSLKSFMSGCANHFAPDCFLNEGRFKKKKKKTQGWISTHCSWSIFTSRRSKSHTLYL